MKKLIFILLAVSFLSARSQNTKKVLFLGNSYTAYNQLPSLVNDIANSLGDTVIYDSNTPGGHRFMNHAVNSTTLSKIASDDWDFVTLQAQSQEPSWPDAQVAAEVFPYAQILVDSIKSNNECTMPVFFMTWGRENGDSFNCAAWPPVCTYEGMDSILAQNYQIMADDNNSVVSPAGAVWRYVRENWSSIDLYSADGSHPSQTGSYAAACTFYTIFFEKDPTLISYNYSLSQADADSIKKAVQVVVYDSLSKWNVGKYNPISDFTPSASSLSVTLTDASTNATNYSWDFGDGNTSTNSNPTHTYSSDGNYNVCLVVSDNCGNSDTTCTTVSVGCAEPVSGFNFSTNGLVVNLTSTSSNYDSLLWSTGDTTNTVNINYDSAGTYNVCLYSFNSCGSDTICQSISITCADPLSDFSYTANGLNVTLTNISTNYDSLVWSTGDTTNSLNLTYDSAGTYSVCLYTYNSCGADTTCESISVTCSNPQTDFNYSTSNLNVTLTNTSSNYDSLLWSTGDTTNNINFTFDSAGTYNVCLYSFNSCGSDTLCQNISVSCPLPISSLSVQNDSTDNYSFTFSNQSSNYDSLTFNLGNGTILNTADTVYAYSDTGSYIVELIVMNECGNSTITDTLTIQDASTHLNDERTYCLNTLKSSGLKNTIWVYHSCNAIEYDFEVFDITGKSIVKRIGIRENDILVTNLKSGVYILSVRSEEFSESRKVVVTD